MKVESWVVLMTYLHEGQILWASTDVYQLNKMYIEQKHYEEHWFWSFEFVGIFCIIVCGKGLFSPKLELSF
jgi:hypothetical protein